MSRSNPTASRPNPACRFYEWNGEKGNLRYYDKANKKQVEVALPFAFVVLDQLATVKGWHEDSQSGIYANEVRDTRIEPFAVKSFKGGPIANGLYANVKDAIAAHGGHFTANVYAGVKIDGKLSIVSLQFKGAALSSWFEFVKPNRTALDEKAVVVNGFGEGKKGKVVYRFPQFKLVPCNADTDTAAKALDVELQDYLKGYFDRTRAAGVAAAATGKTEIAPPESTGDGDWQTPDDSQAPVDEQSNGVPVITEEEIPF